MKYTFHIVDVFSSTPFGGNQLAVLPDAAGISTEGMQKMLANSISAKPPSSCQRTILRTRVGAHLHTSAELDFAGHPTVAQPVRL